MKKVKLLRRSQSLSPFGVGAIIDQAGESFVPADITWWKSDGEGIYEPRLQAHLGVHGFRMIPAAPDRPWEASDAHPGVPCVRFPNWLFCPSCRRMTRSWIAIETPVCEFCNHHPPLVPMRFVMACPRGHLADVPWDYWAHSSSINNRCRSKNLSFITRSGGSGLEFVEVKCLDCNASRSLSGIASRDSLKYLNVRCPGTQPWQRREEVRECDAVPQVLQRGATNLTFHQIESSIDIPPFSSWDAYSDDTTRVTAHPLFTFIRTAWESQNFDLVESAIPMLASQLSLPEDSVKDITYKELGGGYPINGSINVNSDEGDNLLWHEYLALTAADGHYHPGDRFIKRTVDLKSFSVDPADTSYTRAVEMLRGRLSSLVQVTRLREVRALRGFSRLGPVEILSPDEDELPGTFSLYGKDERISPRLVPADLYKLPEKARWLPAIEVYGEGIFLSLDDRQLSEWEQHISIQGRVHRLYNRREQFARYLPLPTPRLILLHTLAHILIRQLSFECGYAISSLRERLYVRQSEDDASMAGILIYTAAGDSEGTLGGLVRQGLPDRMMSTILKAIQNATWCSSDPLCSESQGQGLHSLNLAACHACGLLPETSCVLSNRMLDRVLIVGSLDGSVPGFFTPLINHIQSSLKPE